MKKTNVLVLKKDMWQKAGENMHWIKGDKLILEDDGKHKQAYIPLDKGHKADITSHDEGSIIRLEDCTIVLKD